MISHTLIEITKNMGFIIFKNLKGAKKLLFLYKCIRNKMIIEFNNKKFKL